MPAESPASTIALSLIGKGTVLVMVFAQAAEPDHCLVNIPGLSLDQIIADIRGLADRLETTKDIRCNPNPPTTGA